VVKITLGRWVRLLCISTIACLMIGGGIVTAYAAEVTVNYLLASGNYGHVPDIILEIRDIVVSTVPLVNIADTAIRGILGLWVTFWAGIFVAAQLIIKPLNARKKSVTKYRT
jgi:hypothetical protein